LDTISSVSNETSNNYFDREGPRQLDQGKESPAQIAGSSTIFGFHQKLEK